MPFYGRLIQDGAMKLLIFKFVPVVLLTAIGSVQKITNANSNWTLVGRVEDLINSRDAGF